MKIYTKTGDKGETGLLGGERVSKTSPRIEAYGTIDELNSFIGLAIAEVKDEKVKKVLKKIQNELFDVGADLAAPVTDKSDKLKVKRIPEQFFLDAENAIDEFEKGLEELKHFILPGGSKGASLLHICRTISRRAERRIIALNYEVRIGENIIIYLNRLSDLFFVLARYVNKVSNFPDTIWNK